jgi:hypothetical protein
MRPYSMSNKLILVKLFEYNINPNISDNGVLDKPLTFFGNYSQSWFFSSTC